VDYEPPNWFTATHPTSIFRQDLIVTRARPEARYTLLNGRLTVRTPDARVERQTLRDADGIAPVLAETFDLPVEPEWHAVIERAATTTRAWTP
jgi:N-hydroxyarylamine O-acetyltransferase